MPTRTVSYSLIASNSAAPGYATIPIAPKQTLARMILEGVAGSRTTWRQGKQCTITKHLDGAPRVRRRPHWLLNLAGIDSRYVPKPPLFNESLLQQPLNSLQVSPLTRSPAAQQCPARVRFNDQMITTDETTTTTNFGQRLDYNTRQSRKGLVGRASSARLSNHINQRKRTHVCTVRTLSD